MTSKLPNLLPLEAYKNRSSYLKNVVIAAAIYAPLVLLEQIWMDRPRGNAALLFRIAFFAFFIPLFGRSNSRWENYFYESGGGQLGEPPPAESIYQLACAQGILFFFADRARFVPCKRLWSDHPWKKPVAMEFRPIESVEARVIGSPSRNWLGWWPRIEITTVNTRLVTRVPDVDEAVAQISRAVETLSARPR
jgi:hypothetical protein